MPSTVTPRVSIIIPAYNVAPLIGEALASVFTQTMTDYEAIVVNDGSLDTPALKQAVAPYLDRITYVVRPNGGQSAARNTGIRMARGEFVALLDADDTLLPHFLEEHLSRARRNPAADMFFGDSLIFGNVAEAGRTVMSLGPSRSPVTFRSIVTQESRPALCCLVRRQVLLDHGMFDETLRRCEDFDLWLRMAHGGSQFDFTTRVVARYRRRDDALTADQVAMYDGIQTVLSKCLRTMSLSDADRALISVRIQHMRALTRLHDGKRALAAGDYHAARTAFGEANRVLRRRKLALVQTALRITPRTLVLVIALRDLVLRAVRTPAQG